MTEIESVKLALDRKMRHVRETPASLSFFVALHDFVKYIESAPSLTVFFSGSKKASRAKEMGSRYLVMRRVYQGIEDLDVRSKTDLGHDRYVTINELNLIRNNEFSDNNSLWKHRELLRRAAGEIHKTLQDYLSGIEAKS